MKDEIRAGKSEEDIKSLETLFREYAAELRVDLCFQEFDKELADIKAYYDAALLAGPPGAPMRAELAPAGCVVLKKRSPTLCEMKRLYVRPAARGAGLGRRLADAILVEARSRGYREMMLDTFERLRPAVAMYERMGFVRCAPYYPNPEPDAVYMRIEL